MKQNVLVVGLGEVGRPIYDSVASAHNALGIDKKGDANNNRKLASTDVMHINIPYQVKPSFEEVVAGYIEQYSPRLVIVNSTVKPGTCRKIYERTRALIAHSPIRGVHSRMAEDLLRYTKFIGPVNAEAGKLAEEHFQSIGLKTKVCSSPEATELMKLLCTSYYGLLIAWAQEVSRIGKSLGVGYEELASFWEEIHENLGNRPKLFPGVIGGHCVIPNVHLLKEAIASGLLDEIIKSNELRKEESDE